MRALATRLSAKAETNMGAIHRAGIVLHNRRCEQGRDAHGPRLHAQLVLGIQPAVPSRECRRQALRQAAIVAHTLGHHIWLAEKQNHLDGRVVPPIPRQCGSQHSPRPTPHDVVAIKIVGLEATASEKQVRRQLRHHCQALGPCAVQESLELQRVHGTRLQLQRPHSGGAEPREPEAVREVAPERCQPKRGHVLGQERAISAEPRKAGAARRR
mmetsp:Transcript_41323/g.118886  ORF Transcript_41323/g.118886 Transcript_41323/m.118886 type:complete len:213 (+) Transcript_41323:317-955(+)